MEISGKKGFSNNEGTTCSEKATMRNGNGMTPVASNIGTGESRRLFSVAEKPDSSFHPAPENLCKFPTEIVSEAILKIITVRSSCVC